MKEKIFYSIWKQDLLGEPPYCAVALHQNLEKSSNPKISDPICLPIGNYMGVPSFTTEEEANNHILETLKPYYLSSFQDNYELVFLEFNSEEWIDLMGKCIKCKEDLLNMLNSMGDSGGEH